MKSIMSRVYQLMVLYLVENSPLSLTNTQIVQFFVENNYTDYFNVQETISDLVSNGFLMDINKDNQTTYFITDIGKFEISEFGNQISEVIIDEINEYIDEITILY